MRGDRGDRWDLFTAPAGDHFAQLTALGSDFTNPAINGKIQLRKRRALQSIKWPSRRQVWCSEIFLKGEGQWVLILY
jgi:hypothetical protein